MRLPNQCLVLRISFKHSIPDAMEILMAKLTGGPDKPEVEDVRDDSS